jgi:hypothetical protein
MTPPTELVITLPLPPNMANGRMHWRSKQKRRVAYLEHCVYECILRHVSADAYRLKERHAALAFTLYLGAQMDHDNALARCKWPVDFLVAQGFLHDDSPKWCQFSIPSQVITRDKNQQRLEITITYQEM